MTVRQRNVRSIHLVTVGTLLAMVLLVGMCRDVNEKYTGIVHYSGAEFAGSVTCAECHADVSSSHRHTPHFLSSSQANASNIKGSFETGENVLQLNERIRVVMEETDSGHFQLGFIDNKFVDSARFDIIIGSGRKGQTYLYWSGNSLFQLPVSYHSAVDAWSNSPGYPTDQLLFNRNVPARCLECHSTFMRGGRTIRGNETFVRDQGILGIDCERCHGPAADHVTFHRRNPGEKEGSHIVNPASLDRKQRMDNCALCHSGLRENLMPSFSYLVGQDLDKYSYATQSADSGATLDVHGNQVGLLMASKCFKQSEMDCSSCHNVHRKETGALELFSAKCMTCHTPDSENFCKQSEVHGLSLEKNCIDCHMPPLPSRQVFFRSSQTREPTPFFVRTHLIGVYEEKVKAFLDSLAPATAP